MALPILVQWALRTPEDWAPVTDWARLPSRPVPTGPAGRDQVPGYVCGLAVDGIAHDGHDHYAVVGPVVVMWNDDPEDYTPDRRCAREITPSGQVFYLAGQDYDACRDADIPTVAVLPWASFRPPPDALTRHGCWLSPEQYRAHQAVRTGIWRPTWNEPWLHAGTIAYYRRRYGRAA